MTYAEKLRDPRWQKKRLEILKRDENSCQLCDSTNKDEILNVHHKIYLDNKEPWDYPNELLITYCRPCHEIEEKGRKIAIKELIDNINIAGFLLDDIKLLSRSFSYIRVIKGEESYGVMKLIVKYFQKAIMDYRMMRKQSENEDDFSSISELHNDSMVYLKKISNIFHPLGKI